MPPSQIEMQDAEQHGSSAPGTQLMPPPLASGARFLLVLAALFATHVIIRCVIPSMADLDESEQLTFAQEFRWGYSTQPPLYTWLQLGLFRVFGPSFFALSLLKNILLFGLYACIYASAKRLAQSHAMGVIAALGLMFIPQIAWESQRDLTHSVLATTMAAATLLVFVQPATRAWVRYLLLGVCLGAGTLSNYNYVLFAVGLLGAAVCVKEFRPRVLTPWMLLSLVMAAMLLIPHLVWARDHPELVLTKAHKLKIESAAPWLKTVPAPFLNLAWAWVTHTVSIFIVFAVLCWKQLAPFPRDVLRRPPAKLLLGTIGIAMACVFVTMILTHATSFKGRWLQPLYILAPMLFALVVQPRWTLSASRRISFLAAGVAIVVAGGLSSRGWFDDQRSENAKIPFPQFIAQLGAEVGQVDFLVADDPLTAGNLRLAFPTKPVFTPQFTPTTQWPKGRRGLVVFDATRKSEPPAALSQLLTEPELTSAQWTYAETRFPAPFHKTVRFGFGRVTIE